MILNLEEIKEYLKKNLNIQWSYDYKDDLYITLNLEDQTISKIPFDIE